MDDMDDNQLRKALRSWRVREDVPPDFGRNVWRRIGERGEDSSPKGLIAGEKWIRMMVRRPAYAVGAFACTIAFSILVAHFHARQMNDRHWQELADRYVMSIDPVTQVETLRRR